MDRVRRIVAVLLMAVLGMALAGCGGGAGGNGPDEQSRSPGSDTGANGEETPPNVAGTWIGARDDADEGEAVMIAELDQSGTQVTTRTSIAYSRLGVPVDLNLDGQVVRSQDIELEETVEVIGEDGEDYPVTRRFDGKLVNPTTMEATVSGIDPGRDGDYTLRAVDLRVPEDMALAAVQAVYSQDLSWLEEHVSSELVDDLEAEHGDAIEEDFPDDPDDPDAWTLLYHHFADAMTRTDAEDMPQVGAEITQDQETVVLDETGGGLVVEFDYASSDGNEGEAFVRLVEAGTDEAGDPYQVSYVGVRYGSGGVDHELQIVQ